MQTTKYWEAISINALLGDRRGVRQRSQDLLDNLTLIHMNGRVQDPLLGRFISADPFVPEPLEGQSFNRLSYVHNNPLSFTDPSGFDPETPDDDGDDPADPPVRPRGGFIPLRCGREIYCGVVEPINQDAPYYPHPENFHRNQPQAPPPNEPVPPPCIPGATPGINPVGTPCAPQDTPPPCEEGPSSASGALGVAVYPGRGGDAAAGVHDGRVFATGRVGYGIGGGLTYNPAGGLPVTPSANARGGHQLNVSGKAGVSAGIPFTKFAFSWQFELGVAYDGNDGFIVIKDFRTPKIGLLAEKGIKATANLGGQASVYSSRTNVYVNSGTCRAHY